MFHKKNLIIGVALLSFFGISATYAFSTVDYKSKIVTAMSESQKQRKEAQELYCGYIADLTKKCYPPTRDAAACGTLQVIETDYQTEFSSEAYIDCFGTPAPGTKLSTGEIVESETGIPTQIGDQLFLENEVRLPK